MKLGKIYLSTTQIIILSFLTVVLVGAVLLAMPFSSADGKATSFMDALFTSTTSVCVTGLTTVTTATHWNLFGKILILLLIQIGGLGVPAMAMMVLVVVGEKMSLGYRKLLEDSFNLDTLSGVVAFLRKVVFGTFVVEAIGAVCCLPVFCKDYGILRGIWYSVFHSVSAFCNAGIDILGDSSLMPYVHHVWLNMVTIILIIVGGIGYIVWWDVIRVCKKQKRYLSLHTKIILNMTAFMIVFGTVMYLVFEYNNPETIGSFSVGQKILAGLFQSVTTRTAGFAAISQSGLTTGSVVVSVMLMFIGGSPVGTAGGIKTGTVGVVLLAVYATIRGRKDVTAFGKRIPLATVMKAGAVIVISLITSLVALTLMLVFVGGSGSDIVFEVYSAIGTAGLSRDFTSSMNLIGKIIICACMFLGRIGPMSLVLALTAKKDNESVRFIEEDVTVG